MSNLVPKLLITAAGLLATAAAVAGEIILFEHPDFGRRRGHKQYPYSGPPTWGSPR